MFSKAASLLAPAARVGVRSFSTEKVSMPIQLYGLSGRYASALYATATRQGNLPAVESEIETIASWISDSETLRDYLKNPIISRKDKVADMEKISAGMSDTTRGFLCILADNGRLNETAKIAESFELLMNASRGLVEATVVSAEELSSGQLSQLESALSAGYLEEGQSLKLDAKVDPTILGGLQVQVGDRFVDLSIQAKINKMHQVLSEA